MIEVRYIVAGVLGVPASLLATDLLVTLHDIRNELRDLRKRREAKEQILKLALPTQETTKADWAVLDRERPDFFKP